MGKSNRIRANRSDSRISAPIKAKKKQGMPSWLLSTIIILLTVAVLFTVIGSVLSANGTLNRMRTTVYSDNYKVTGSMMAYFYHSAYQNFQSSYSSYMAKFSIDTEKSLKSQTFGDPALGGLETSYLGAFEGSWYDYFMQMAIDNAKQILAFCEEANARGLALNDEDKAEIDAQIESLDLLAAQSLCTTSQYITYTYGDGVKVKDIRKCLELSFLATKGMQAVQDDVLAAITDTDISDKYASAKDNYDLIDYLFYTGSVKLEDIKKQELGSDYTAAEYEEKKEEVDAIFKERLEEEKKMIAELEAIKDKNEFIKHILKFNAGKYYDVKYEAVEGIKDVAPEAAILETIKATMIDKIVTEVLDGKTETETDVVTEKVKDAEGNETDAYAIYENKVDKKFADAMTTIKTDVFKSVLSDLTKYQIEKSKYSATSDFSKWAFEAGRVEGELKTITNTDKEEEYSTTVYMLTKTRYADAVKSKKLAYMLFTDETSAKGAIEKLKAATLSLETFNSIAAELTPADSGELKDYVEGSLSLPALDEWAYSDTIKLGDYTTSPINLGDGSFFVGYYCEEGPEAWKVTVKNEIFNERFSAKNDEIIAKYVINTKDRNLKKVSDGHLPELLHSHQ